MKEEKTKKRKVLYYVVLILSVCLLIAATVLTVYFVSGAGNEMLQEEPPSVTPVEPDKPKEPDKPTGGEAETFVLPIEYEDVTVFNDIYRSKTTGYIYRHQGVDFMAEAGTSVNAIADGTVEKISLSERNGNLIVVDHGDGIKGYYKFVDPVSTLKVGSKVVKGQTIATVAAAHGPEAKDGDHLHFELTVKNKLADPASYLDIQYDAK